MGQSSLLVIYAVLVCGLSQCMASKNKCYRIEGVKDSSEINAYFNLYSRLVKSKCKSTVTVDFEMFYDIMINVKVEVFRDIWKLLKMNEKILLTNYIRSRLYASCNSDIIPINVCDKLADQTSYISNQILGGSVSIRAHDGSFNRDQRVCSICILQNPLTAAGNNDNGSGRNNSRNNSKRSSKNKDNNLNKDMMMTKTTNNSTTTTTTTTTINGFRSPVISELRLPLSKIIDYKSLVNPDNIVSTKFIRTSETLNGFNKSIRQILPHLPLDLPITSALVYKFHVKVPHQKRQIDIARKHLKLLQTQGKRKYPEDHCVFHCGWTGQCLFELNKVCNGHDDCFDRSDEYDFVCDAVKKVRLKEQRKYMQNKVLDDKNNNQLFIVLSIVTVVVLTISILLALIFQRIKKQLLTLELDEKGVTTSSSSSKRQQQQQQQKQQQKQKQDFMPHKVYCVWLSDGGTSTMSDKLKLKTKSRSKNKVSTLIKSDADDNIDNNNIDNYGYEDENDDADDDDDHCNGGRFCCGLLDNVGRHGFKLSNTDTPSTNDAFSGNNSRCSNSIHFTIPKTNDTSTQSKLTKFSSSSIPNTNCQNDCNIRCCQCWNNEGDKRKHSNCLLTTVNSNNNNNNNNNNNHYHHRYHYHRPHCSRHDNLHWQQQQQQQNKHICNYYQCTNSIAVEDGGSSSSCTMMPSNHQPSTAAVCSGSSNGGNCICTSSKLISDVTTTTSIDDDDDDSTTVKSESDECCSRPSQQQQQLQQTKQNYYLSSTRWLYKYREVVAASTSSAVMANKSHKLLATSPVGSSSSNSSSNKNNNSTTRTG